VLITVTDEDKPDAVQVAREFQKLGFKIRTTKGTHQFLSDNGIESEPVLKMYEGRPGIADEIKNQKIQLVINTPIGKLGKHDDSYIRKTAIKHKIPYITTMAAAKATVKGIAAQQASKRTVKSLQSYHADIDNASQHKDEKPKMVNIA
jgi:carbamoyl-phosphate synthase large subunit